MVENLNNNMHINWRLTTIGIYFIEFLADKHKNIVGMSQQFKYPLVKTEKG
jgi:hypothetical protein